MAAVAITVSPVNAQELVPGTWITDGTVAAVACDERNVYLGGFFSALAPPTGSGAVIGLGGRGKLWSGPRVSGGSVNAVAPDGSGGWLVGGDFQQVGGMSRPYLAHVLADGSISDWSAVPDHAVRELQVVSGRLYVCGEFTRIGGVPRNGVAAVNVADGTLSDWDPHIEYGLPYTLTVAGGTAYVGGLFEFVGGRPRSNLAAVDAVTGAVRDWAPNPEPTVRAVGVSEGIVYIAGEFTHVGGVARNGLAAIDAQTGAVTPWTADARATLPRMLVDDGTVYLFGPNGVVSRGRLRAVVALDARSGAIRAWDPRADPHVLSLVRHGSELLVGGDFIRLGGVPRHFAGAVDVRSATIRDWDPVALGSVKTIAAEGGVAYVGGAFDGIGGVLRDGLAALDASTGEPTDWSPSVNPPWHRGVLSLAVHDRTLFVAGRFDSIDGEPRGCGAAFDIPSLKLTSWDPRATWDQMPSQFRYILTVAATDSVIYLSGDFNHLGSADRQRLGAVRADDGRPTAWTPRLSTAPDTSHTPGYVGYVKQIATLDGAIYLLGDFDYVNGASRPVLAAVDPSVGATLGWTPPVTRESPVFSIAVHEHSVIAGGSLDVRAFDAATGALQWQQGADPPARAMLAVGDVLYLADPTTVASLDLDTHAQTGSSSRFGTSPFSETALSSNGSDLWISGWFRSPEDGSMTNLARFRLSAERHAPRRAALAAPAAPASLAALGAGPGTSVSFRNGVVRFVIPHGDRISLDLFDVQGRRIAALLDREWQAGGAHEIAVGSSWSAGIYLCRFQSGGRVIMRRIVVLP